MIAGMVRFLVPQVHNPGWLTNYPAMLGQTEKGEKPDPVVFREWLKDVQTLLQYLKRHQDRPSLESLRNQRDRIKDILKSMGALKSDKVCKRKHLIFFF
jgi:hypothetical protein